jgi:hypothetical protein
VQSTFRLRNAFLAIAWLAVWLAICPWYFHNSLAHLPPVIDVLVGIGTLVLPFVAIGALFGYTGRGLTIGTVFAAIWACFAGV